MPEEKIKKNGLVALILVGLCEMVKHKMPQCIKQYQDVFQKSQYKHI